MLEQNIAQVPSRYFPNLELPICVRTKHTQKTRPILSSTLISLGAMQAHISGASARAFLRLWKSGGKTIPDSTPIFRQAKKRASCSANDKDPPPA